MKKEFEQLTGGKEQHMVKIYSFREHDVLIQGEKHNLIELAEKLRSAGVEGTWGDLVYKIECEFSLNGITSDNAE